MTVLLTLSVIVAGIATYGKLAVNDLPAVDYPIIQVTCSYPGADPTTMANNIATPLEKQFLQIPGLDIITSNSTQSNTSLTLQFVLSKSITDAATDVQAAIQRATGKLPIDLPSPPTFTKTNPNDQAVYLLGLLSDTLTDWDLYKVRVHRCRAAYQHPAGRVAGEYLRRAGSDSSQGRPVGAGCARVDDG